jgi:hypothetical protein
LFLATQSPKVTYKLNEFFATEYAMLADCQKTRKMAVTVAKQGKIEIVVNICNDSKSDQN